MIIFRDIPDIALRTGSRHYSMKHDTPELVSLKFQPLIIGGMGGSGTRVVAQILEKSGVYIGSFLNAASDALLFSAFGNPHRVHWSYTRLKPYLQLFEKLHFQRGLSPVDFILLAHSFSQSAFLRKHRKVVLAACRRRTLPPTRGWGWKNPPNQYFLSQLNAHYPNCFYIHVLRHGLDMAFSANTNQLQRYGKQMDIPETAPVPVRQLQLWIKTNQNVLSFTQQHMPGRHAVIYLEELCKDPGEVISRLFTLAGLQTSVPLEQLADIVQSPESSGRFLTKDLSIFPADHLQALHQTGYQTDSILPQHVHTE